MDAEWLTFGEALLCLVGSATLFFFGLPLSGLKRAIIVILGITVFVSAVDKIMQLDEHRIQTSIIKFGGGSTDGR